MRSSEFFSMGKVTFMGSSAMQIDSAALQQCRHSGAKHVTMRILCLHFRDETVTGITI